MLPSIAQLLLATLALYLIKRRSTPRSAFGSVPGPTRESWWKGCFYQVFNLEGWQFHHDIVEKYGSVIKLPMLFGYDELYVTDPLALHHILVKDQYIFEETSMFIASNALIFGKSLISTLGDDHRRQRKMLNPVFSMKHMRDLLPIFYPIVYNLRSVLEKQIRGGTKEIDLLHWLSRTALECIGQGGLGYSFDAFHNGEATKYGAYVKKLGPLFFKTTFHRQFLPWLSNIGSARFRRKVVECMPSKTIRDSIEIIDVLDSQSRSIYQEKKAALENGDEEVCRKVGLGKDILSVLLKANMSANENDRLPEDEVIGQLNTLILAGQDTTSHALSRALHLLSLNMDVQKRLRDEIIAARKEREGTDVDYDTLMGLPYLDAICRETLRMYPPISMLTRTTRKDAVLPLTWPIPGTDGRTMMAEVAVKKNTNVIVSIIGANRSKKIWGEDAEEWKPGRWLNPLPETAAKERLPGVYSSMMTFIGGGRACIGFKFAEMEMKLVLAVLLESFEFKVGPELEWRMSGVARPALRHSKDKTAQLPLNVSFLDGK